LTIYESALAEYPQQPRILYNLGLTYALSGDFPSSLGTLDTLNDLTADGNVKYLKALGGVAAAATEGELAVDAWLRVLELDPVDMDTRMRLVDAYVDSGDFESAYRTLLQAYGLQQYSKMLFEKLSELEVSSGNGDGVSWKLIANTYT
jgi:Flp pilus assembly protein TadD